MTFVPVEVVATLKLYAPVGIGKLYVFVPKACKRIAPE